MDPFNSPGAPKPHPTSYSTQASGIPSHGRSDSGGGSATTKMSGLPNQIPSMSSGGSRKDPMHPGGPDNEYHSVKHSSGVSSRLARIKSGEVLNKDFHDGANRGSGQRTERIQSDNEMNAKEKATRSSGSSAYETPSKLDHLARYSPRSALAPTSAEKQAQSSGVDDKRAAAGKAIRDNVAARVRAEGQAKAAKAAKLLQERDLSGPQAFANMMNAKAKLAGCSDTAYGAIPIKGSSGIIIPNRSVKNSGTAYGPYNENIQHPEIMPTRINPTEGGAPKSGQSAQIMKVIASNDQRKKRYTPNFEPPKEPKGPSKQEQRKVTPQLKLTSRPSLAHINPVYEKHPFTLGPVAEGKQGRTPQEGRRFGKAPPAPVVDKESSKTPFPMGYRAQ